MTLDPVQVLGVSVAIAGIGLAILLKGILPSRKNEQTPAAIRGVLCGLGGVILLTGLAGGAWGGQQVLYAAKPYEQRSTKALLNAAVRGDADALPHLLRALQREGDPRLHASFIEHGVEQLRSMPMDTTPSPALSNWRIGLVAQHREGRMDNETRRALLEIAMKGTGEDVHFEVVRELRTLASGEVFQPIFDDAFEKATLELGRMFREYEPESNYDFPELRAEVPLEILNNMIRDDMLAESHWQTLFDRLMVSHMLIRPRIRISEPSAVVQWYRWMLPENMKDRFVVARGVELIDLDGEPLQHFDWQQERGKCFVVPLWLRDMTNRGWRLNSEDWGRMGIPTGEMELGVTHRVQIWNADAPDNASPIWSGSFREARSTEILSASAAVPRRDVYELRAAHELLGQFHFLLWPDKLLVKWRDNPKIALAHEIILTHPNNPDWEHTIGFIELRPGQLPKPEYRYEVGHIDMPPPGTPIRIELRARPEFGHMLDDNPRIIGYSFVFEHVRLLRPTFPDMTWQYNSTPQYVYMNDANGRTVDILGGFDWWDLKDNNPRSIDASRRGGR